MSTPSPDYLDPAVASLPADAEVLFTRGLAYCGAVSTKGMVPEPIVASLVRDPSRAKCRRLTGLLVTAGLWVPVDGGWRYRSWDHWQDALDAVAERRRRDRDRKARKRS